MRKDMNTVLMALCVGALVMPPLAWAEKPNKHGRSPHFLPEQRTAVSVYFQSEAKQGHCPPGLAKKNNGCQPPGQAKNWRRGAPLPAGVVTYPIAPELRVKLGVPPPGHEFVRVAGDILLIAVGTSMVMDAIEDLTR